MASIRLDQMLREFTPKLSLASDAGSVEGVVADLESRFPRLRFRLRDEYGKQRRFVRIFLNGEDVAGLQGLSTPVGPADHIDILHSIQGG